MPDFRRLDTGLSPNLQVLDVGLMPYAEALELQLAYHKSIRSGNMAGVLLLVEHPPVITLGMSAHQENLLVSDDMLKANGIELVKTDRGGDVTYHGPGQIVGYPIINLRSIGSDVHRFLRLIECMVISTLADFGISGSRNGPAGVWIGDKKICSIGIAVRGGVTYHGFALNVCPNLAHFELINPCGLQAQQITSLERLIDSAPDMETVRRRITEHFERDFEITT